MAKILIIEDNAALRTMLKDALAPLGHSVLEAADGADGIRMVEREKFDLVITDMIMPGRWGTETIVQIKRIRPEAKILAISGAGRGKNVELLETAYKLGANASLSKPFTMKELRLTLSELVGENKDGE
jgi:CheY-like chemotaxis protein